MRLFSVLLFILYFVSCQPAGPLSKNGFGIFGNRISPTEENGFFQSGSFQAHTFNFILVDGNGVELDSGEVVQQAELNLYFTLRNVYDGQTGEIMTLLEEQVFLGFSDSTNSAVTNNSFSFYLSEELNDELNPAEITFYHHDFNYYTSCEFAIVNENGELEPLVEGDVLSISNTDAAETNIQVFCEQNIDYSVADFALELQLVDENGDLINRDDMSLIQGVGYSTLVLNAYSGNGTLQNMNLQGVFKLGNIDPEFDTTQLTSFQVSTLANAEIYLQDETLFQYSSCQRTPAATYDERIIVSYEDAVNPINQGKVIVKVHCSDPIIADDTHQEHHVIVKVVDANGNLYSIPDFNSDETGMILLNFKDYFRVQTDQIHTTSVGFNFGHGTASPFYPNQAKYKRSFPIASTHDLAIDLYTDNPLTSQGFANQCELLTSLPITLSYDASLNNRETEIIIKCEQVATPPVEYRTLSVKLSNDSADFANAGHKIPGIIEFASPAPFSLPHGAGGLDTAFNYPGQIPLGSFVIISLDLNSVPSGWSCSFVDDAYASGFNLTENTVVEIACLAVVNDQAKVRIEYNSSIADVLLSFNGPDGLDSTVFSQSGDFFEKEYLKDDSNFTFSISAPLGYKCQIDGQDITSIDGDLSNGDKTYSVTCQQIQCQWVNSSPAKCIQFADPENTCAAQNTCAIKYAQEDTCTGEKRLKMVGCTACDSDSQCSQFWPMPVMQDLNSSQ
jgi:hypothetical protein